MMALETALATRKADRWSLGRSLLLHALLILVLAAALSTGCGREAAESPRWNVVLIVVDTLRADHLRMYGYDRSTSPFLEELSRHGLVFQEARSNAGCTFPSVNSLLTSRSPQIFLESMKAHGWGIPESTPSLAEMLRKAGYDTAAASASPIIRVNPGPLNPDGGYGAGFSQFDDSCEAKLPDGRIMGAPASCINDRASQMLDELAEPFFLYLHYFDPHDPYQPPTGHERVFAASDYGKAWVDDGTLIPMYRMLYKEGPHVDFDDQDLAHAIDLYDEEIRYFDSELAKLIARLKRDGVYERTLLVLTSDHGEEFLEHDHLFHCKDLTYDTAVKTPLIVWVPGLERPRSISGLAQNLDVVPTILDYLKLDRSDYLLEGKSLRPLIEDTASIHQYVFGVQKHTRFVVDGRFKLTYNIKTGEAQLFDLESDPLESIDIITRRPQLAEELIRVLLRWVETVEGDVAVATRVEKASEVTERLRALGYL